MHYFQFNIRDWRSKTAHLTAAEDLAYRRLTEEYYIEEKPLPNNIPELARKIRMRDSEVDIERVLNEFFHLEEDGNWHKERCDSELKKVSSSSEAGKIGAAKRWKNKDINSPLIKSHMRKNSPPKVSPMQPITHNPIPITHNPKEEFTSTCVDGNAPEKINQAVEAWNRLASDLGLAKVLKLTPARKAKLRARLHDCCGLEGWKLALEKIRKSPFLRGEKTDWRADFDFLLQEKSFTKLMEGAYDERTETPEPEGNNGHPPNIPPEISANLLRAGIELRQQRQWLDGAHFDLEQRKIIVDTAFKRDWIANNFETQLTAALGFRPAISLSGGHNGK